VLLGWVVAGVIVLVLGGVVLLAAIALNSPQDKVISSQSSQTGESVPPAYELTQMTANVRWAGAASGTETYLVVNANAPFGFACGGGGMLVAEGQGPAGSFSAGVQPGTSYLLYACVGTHPESLSFNLTLSGGVTVGEIVGGVGLAAGGVVLVIGLKEHTADPAEVERIFGPRDPPRSD
jgi:hypothetical protein